jgi:hypothetical protein
MARPYQTFLFALGAAALGPGCGGSEAAVSAPESPQFLTGEVDGTDARVGVITTDKQARFYFCGGANTYTKMTVWLPVDIGASGAVSLGAGAPAGFALAGTLAGGVANGTFTAGTASPATFHAAPVSRASIGGLYEAQAPCGHVGVIVADESPPDPPVVQGACIGNVDPPSFEQVNPLSPLTRGADGSIRVTIPGSTDVIAVAAAAAP